MIEMDIDVLKNMGDLMQRYFIKSDQLVDGQAIISGDDAHHIINVMRANIGDHIILCTCDKKSYLVEIIALCKAEVRTKLIETKEENIELPISVTIAQGIPKGNKFDLVIQKATECGASGFVPVAMKRSVAKIDASKASKKVERWQKIALEAARQSHRQVVPNVHMPVDIKGLLAMEPEFDACLFAYEEFDTDSKHELANAIAQFTAGMCVLVLIGPEGGIDASEVELLTNAGFSAVGLGPRILRTETAPIYVMSVLSYALEVERRLYEQ